MTKHRLVWLHALLTTFLLSNYASGQEGGEDVALEDIPFESEEQATSEEQPVSNEQPASDEQSPSEELDDELVETPSDTEENPMDDYFAERGREHTGFYLRGTLGLCYGSGSETVEGTEFKSGGFGLLLSAAIGGAIVENLIINADLFVS